MASEEKVAFVLNGVDVIGGENGGSPEAYDFSGKNGQSNSNGTVRIGIVGQIGEWKGHSDFVEALKGLKESQLSFKGVIFGDGDTQYIASLKEKIASYKMTPDIRWAGFVKNTREIFDLTDICVVPSRSQDPCPTVAIEAAQCGVPLIATRRGGLPELVRDGETGYLVDAEAPEQITEKLKLLIQDGDLRRRMALAAKQHSSQHLSRERMVREMETLFERMLELEGDVG